MRAFLQQRLRPASPRPRSCWTLRPPSRRCGEISCSPYSGRSGGPEGLISVVESLYVENALHGLWAPSSHLVCRNIRGGAGLPIVGHFVRHGHGPCIAPAACARAREWRELAPTIWPSHFGWHAWRGMSRQSSSRRAGWQACAGNPQETQGTRGGAWRAAAAGAARARQDCMKGLRSAASSR